MEIAQEGENMSDVKEGLKKGTSVVGKVVKWVLLALLLFIVGTVAYSCYACTSATKAVVDVVSGNETQGSASPTTSEVTSIIVEDPKDIPFLHNDSRIRVGQTYEVTVNTWFKSLMGTTLLLGTSRDGFDTFGVEVKTRIPDFQRNDPVRVVLLYTPGRFATELSFMNSELVSIEKR